jgi:hypothetical protein
MALAAREHRAAVVEVEMSGPQKLDADQPDIALAHDLLSKKAPVFAHLEEVLGDHTLTLAAKRSLLASWASDALGVEDCANYRAVPPQHFLGGSSIPSAHAPRTGVSTVSNTYLWNDTDTHWMKRAIVLAREG